MTLERGGVRDIEPSHLADEADRALYGQRYRAAAALTESSSSVRESGFGMGTVRIALVADLHCTKTSRRAFQPLFAGIREAADLLLIAGDLTDYGLPEEALVPVARVSAVRIPVVAVLGNHDVESSKQADVAHVLREGNQRPRRRRVRSARCRDCRRKGVLRRFRQRALAPWGEAVLGFCPGGCRRGAGNSRRP